MKHTTLLLTITLLVSAAHAQPAYWRTSADIDLSERVTEYNGDIAQPEVYEQKGGYRLILRPVAWVENGMRLRATQVYIEKDGKLRLLPENDACSDFIGNKYLNRYEGVDFDGYFIIAIYDGIWRHSLYEKSSGKLILQYENHGGAIHRENLLIYNSSLENEEAYLFDLKTLKNTRWSRTLKRSGRRCSCTARIGGRIRSRFFLRTPRKPRSSSAATTSPCSTSRAKLRTAKTTALPLMWS